MLFNILTVVSLSVAISVIIYITIYNDRITRFISVNKLGIIERDLQNLKQVVVVAHIVEKPDSALELAVERNFAKGIRYLFLVSGSNAAQELKGYYLIFKALAEIAIAKTNKNINLKALVEIKKLTFNWPDVPYIFYQCLDESTGEKKIIAYRGNQKGEGIADYYERLSDSQSMAISRALLAEAPSEIKENLPLTDPMDIVPTEMSKENMERFRKYPN